jgi:molybdenum cofactor cytidylyltransferase
VVQLTDGSGIVKTLSTWRDSLHEQNYRDDALMPEVLVAGLVLASGLSSRFGQTNKLLADVDGRTVVERSVRAYLDAGLHPVIVVVGHDADSVQASLRDLPVLFVHNPSYAEGQSRGLARGVAALPGAAVAAVIGVGDQPWLQPETIERLVEEWRDSQAPVVAPLYSGQRGNPVLFARALFDELEHIEGDMGGRPVIRRHADEVRWVPVADASQARDVDVPADLIGDDQA